MSFINRQLFECYTMGAHTYYTYFTPDLPEELESADYWRSADRLERLDQIKVIADCSSNNPLIAELLVVDRGHDYDFRPFVTVKRYSSWLRSPAEFEDKEDFDRDDDVLVEEVAAAIRLLDENDPKSWNMDGRPDARHLKSIVGFEVVSDVRDKAWSIVHGEREAVAAGDIDG